MRGPFRSIGPQTFSPVEGQVRGWLPGTPRARRSLPTAFIHDFTLHNQTRRNCTSEPVIGTRGRRVRPPPPGDPERPRAARSLSAQLTPGGRRGLGRSRRLCGSRVAGRRQEEGEDGGRGGARGRRGDSPLGPIALLLDGLCDGDARVPGSREPEGEGACGRRPRGSPARGAEGLPRPPAAPSPVLPALVRSPVPAVFRGCHGRPGSGRGEDAGRTAAVPYRL